MTCHVKLRKSLMAKGPSLPGVFDTFGLLDLLFSFLTA